MQHLAPVTRNALVKQAPQLLSQVIFISADLSRVAWRPWPLCDLCRFAQVEKLRPEQVDMPEWLKKAEEVSQSKSDVAKEMPRDSVARAEEKRAASHKKVSGVSCPHLACSCGLSAYVFGVPCGFVLPKVAL